MRPVNNPPNPWLSAHRQYLDEAPPAARLTVMEEDAASILSSNDSPDLGFTWTLNPYRGCFHGCIYCYARPTHQYLGHGAGTDFERLIIAKVNAAARLEEAFQKRSWRGETVMFSGVTDCYQPLEASYGLTRDCLAVCARFRNPVAIITKGALVCRDVDVLQQLARDASAQVFVSIPVLDEDVARVTEPYASPPRRRLEAIATLAKAGVQVGVAVAPIIPGLTDVSLVEILTRARDAGAARAFMTMLRLPGEVKPVFLERIGQGLSPARQRHVLSAVADMRDGALNNSTFGERFRGQGPRWDALAGLFALTCQRLGLGQQEWTVPNTFVRPGTQMTLALPG